MHLLLGPRPRVGSPQAVWEIVTKLAESNPREAMLVDPILPCIPDLVVCFRYQYHWKFWNCVLDNGYFNKAFAANPLSTYKGYIFGSLAWCAIPALCSLTMGFAALALEHTEYWPLGRPMTAAEVASGLVLPNAASALLGKAGAVLALLMVFMAVTSAMSAELIAVSQLQHMIFTELTSTLTLQEKN